jgi:hypothetical protein
MPRLVVALALCAVLAGCGGGEDPCPPRIPTPLDRAQTGTLTGTVGFQGEPPAMPPLRITSECAAEHEGAVTKGDVLVKDGRVQNAFVWIKDGLGDRVFATPATPITIDQTGCFYVPHVAGVQTCQEVVFLNSDPFMHNVHGAPADSPGWNFSMSIKGGKRTIRIPHPEVMVSVRCDVHPWMQVYLGVVDHPYFRVTGPDGTFRLADVPAGDYVVGAWHERFGTREARVTLAAGETKDLAFSFGGTGAGGN